jgi:membrane-associated protease RseP (regulator of RpoE activity)
MRISVGRWAASLSALLLVLVAALPSAARSDEGDDTAWLGVFTQELSPGLEEALDHHGDAVLVTRVVSGSPAERAGLKKGDLIVRVEGEGVDSPAELARLVQKHDVGDAIEIQIVRDGDRRTLTAKLGSRSDESDDSDKMKVRVYKHDRADETDEDDDSAKTKIERFKHDKSDDAEDEDDGGDDDKGARHSREFRIQIPDVPGAPDAPDAPIGPMMNRARLGVRIENLGSDLSEYFDVKEGRGALVVDVIDGSPAKKIGIKPGDVIVDVDGRDIGDTDDLIRAIGDAKGHVSVTVVRHGARRTFETELAPAPEGRLLRLGRPGMNAWRFDGNTWRRGTNAPDGRSRADMERELRELREELKELKEDLKELRER